MSLLDCICSPVHEHKTAVCWDDLKQPLTWTYSELFARVHGIACYLRRSAFKHSEPAIVALYGHNCPEILAAMLGILALPAAYLPVDISRVDLMEVLREHSVNTLLVHLPMLESFLSRISKDCTVEFDSTLLEHGVVIAELNGRDKLATRNGRPSIHRASGVVGREHKPCSSGTLCSHCKGLLAQLQQDGFSPKVSALYHQVISEYFSKSTSEPLTDSNNTNIHTSTPHIKHTCPPLLEKGAYASSHLPDWGLPVVSPTSLAYVLHTSGTTGQPKPVKVPHCSIVPNILDLRARFSVSSDDVVFNAAPLTFDPSVVEIFLALSTGATLLTVPEKVKRSPASLASILFHRQRASVLQVTPALAYQLAAASQGSFLLLGAWSSLRVLAFGGEDCPSLHLLQRWKQPGNETLVFNLYGITEVSSWATCQHIALHSDAVEVDSVGGQAAVASSVGGQATVASSVGRQAALGQALLGTVIEVRDDNGIKLKQGFGEIWIGGEYRVCLVGGEEELVWGSMRPSGDHGFLDGCGSLFFEGRCDDQIKRAGHRVNLSSIQQEILSFDLVSACALAATAKESFSSSPLSELLGLAPHYLLGLTQLLLAFVVPASPMGDSSHLLQSYLSLQSTIKRALPSYCVPDLIIFVKTLPTTEHGKVDLRSLIDCAFPEIYLPVQHTAAPDEAAASPQSSQLTPLINTSIISSVLKAIASQNLGIEGWTGCLLDHGASSFDVVFLANRFEQELKGRFQIKLNIPLLVDHLLSKSLCEVAQYVCGSAHARDEVTSRKRTQDGSENFEKGPASKRPLMATDSVGNGRMHSWRRGQHFINGELQPNTITQLPSTAALPSDKLACSFTVRWKVDTGKCVDASPLLVCGEDGRRPPMVYVGSHSGLLCAIAASSGEVMWSTQLSDRVESSACLSVCGHYVVVGCYDGCVYTVSVASGEVHWCLQSSSEPVKSSPCADPITGLVWFGSHDHNLYAIDVTAKCVVHCLHLGGGACFSSPCLDTAARRLYCASLRGVLTAVDTDTGAAVWSFQCPKPIFSSPALLNEGSVVVGCVDGLLYVLGSSGIMKTVLKTEKPVFSSCCVVVDTNTGTSQTQAAEDIRDESSTNIYCGSHDNYVHCWNGNWELEWKTQLASEVYSIPCHCLLKLDMCSAPPKQTVEVFCICVCSTNGDLFIISCHGDIIGQFQLPGAVFSSPAALGNAVTVGCRDNNVYCLEVSVDLLH